MKKVKAGPCLVAAAATATAMRTVSELAAVLSQVPNQYADFGALVNSHALICGYLGLMYSFAGSERLR